MLRAEETDNILGLNMSVGHSLIAVFDGPDTSSVIPPLEIQTVSGVYRITPETTPDTPLVTDVTDDDHFSKRGPVPGKKLITELPPEQLFVEGQIRTPWKWHFLPQGVLYPTYWASAPEPRMATHLIQLEGQGTQVDSHIGGRIALLKFGPVDDTQGFQLDLRGGAKLRQNMDQNLDVDATDYRFDILGTWAYGKHRFKAGFYHVSSHVGDDFLIRNPGFVVRAFLRDTAVFGYSYNPTPELRLYAEVGYAFQRAFSQPLEFQFGADYGPYAPTGPKGAPFAAFNVHLREELDFGGNIALQAGWAWRGEYLYQGILRTGLYYYNGGSSQFSFYDQQEQQIGMGLWYDY